MPPEVRTQRDRLRHVQPGAHAARGDQRHLGPYGAPHRRHRRRGGDAPGGELRAHLASDALRAQLLDAHPRGAAQPRDVEVRTPQSTSRRATSGEMPQPVSFTSSRSPRPSPASHRLVPLAEVAIALGLRQFLRRGSGGARGASAPMASLSRRTASTPSRDACATPMLPISTVVGATSRTAKVDVSSGRSAMARWLPDPEGHPELLGHQGELLVHLPGPLRAACHPRHQEGRLERLAEQPERRNQSPSPPARAWRSAPGEPGRAASSSPWERPPRWRTGRGGRPSAWLSNRRSLKARLALPRKGPKIPR